MDGLAEDFLLLLAEHESVAHQLIERGGQASLKALRETGLVPNAPRILQRDVYGWFRRLQRATYALTTRARQDIGRFAASQALPDLAAGATIRD